MAVMGVQMDIDTDILSRRDAWAAAKSSKTLLLPAAELFSADGTSGIFDVLDKVFRVQNCPKSTSSPWTLFLNQGQIVSIWIDGRAKVFLGTGTIEAADNLESVLKTTFLAEEITMTVYKDLVGQGAVGQARIWYGTQSTEVKSKLSALGFH